MLLLREDVVGKLFLVFFSCKFTSSIKNPSDNPVVTTVYHVQVTNTYGDVKTASVQVVVYPLPQVDCPAFMEACEGDPLVVLNSAFPQNGQYSGLVFHLMAPTMCLTPE